MKKFDKFSSVFRGLALGAAVLASAPMAKAANAYFTTATPGTGTFSWDANNWSTVVGGPFNTAYVQGSFPRFNGTGTYTVTCSAVESMAGMFGNASLILTLTNIGSGGFTLPAGGVSATQNGYSWLAQGFFTAGGTVNLNLPITGAGGVGQNSGGGNLNLYGSNSFTGGVLVNSSATFLGYNNSNSFGAATSQIGFNGTTFAVMNCTGTNVNIPNPIQTINNCGVNFIGNSETMSGNWYLGGGASAINIRNNGVAGTVLTLAGVMSATSGGVNYSSANGNTIVLTKNNTYTGPTSVGVSGAAAITLEIASTGSIASTTITNGGTLKLDAATCLKTNATLQLTTTANSANLNFSGTQSIAALYIGGVVQVGGTWGSSTSGAANTSPVFTGSGILSTPAAPGIVQQPQSVGRYDGGSATFSVVASGAPPLSYQWYLNNGVIAGATTTSYVVSPTVTNGTYKVVVSNSVGSVTSANASLTIIPSNAYTGTIVSDSPLAYWRFDETNGTVALDSVSTNNGTYSNVTLGQPGFSLTDTDKAIGLPASTNARGYMSVSSAPFNFTSGNGNFSLEGWAYFTNLTGVQRLFSTLGNGNGYAFGINGNNGLRFTQGAVQDADYTSGSPLFVTGQWYHIVVTCDDFTYTYYVNGNQVGTVSVTGGITAGVGFNSVNPLTLGSDPVAYTFTAEQVKGNLDEMAVYNSVLSSSQVLAHYNARYGSLAAPVVTAPSVSPATNYVSLSSTFYASAAGQALSYQWYQGASAIAGATSSTFTVAPLQLSSAGAYYVQVSNPAGTSNSPTATLTVLPIPTNYTDLNLTNSLVVHLPFDNTLNDASGHGNNGTNVGATSFVSGVVGTNALHYSTASGSTNYVTLGVRSDLQFGSNVNFSVSFWIRQPAGSTFTNLPFFTDAIGSTGNGGFAFAPYSTTGGGGEIWTVGSVSSPNNFTSFSDVNLINDGNWHNLTYVADRTANLTVYIDGNQFDSQSISFVGSINTANAATIGQDPTGAYPVTASADMDDLGVWTRTLTPLEVSGIYLAGATNGVSFGPGVVPVVPVALHITNNGGTVTITWAGSGTLQSATAVNGTYTDVVGATSPYTVPSSGTNKFYRLRY